MSIPAPHFLLRAECNRFNQPGDWRFVLHSADGRRQAEVEDIEPAVHGQRLELLAVIRGLEAIDRPARVTLLTGSAYVRRGIKYGLDDWRASGWQWERHGEMVPVKNSDLWQRLDRALQVHRVECRLLRINVAHSPQTEIGRRKAEEQIQRTDGRRTETQVVPVAPSEATRHGWQRKVIACRRWWREAVVGLRVRLAQFGIGLLPRPWLE